MNSQTQTDTATNNQDQSFQDMGGIDDIIARVDEYIKDPKMVTVQTLTDLKNDLMDLKQYLDEEEGQEGETDQNKSEPNGGIAIMIANAKKRGMQ